MHKHGEFISHRISPKENRRNKSIAVYMKFYTKPIVLFEEPWVMVFWKKFMKIQ
jgi:hypothetical protein